MVCPAIDSEHLEMESAERIYKSFSKGPFKAFRLALLHGQMKSSEKERVMTEFVRGEIHMLISTSVVEVGIDVPNATIMMIRSSHRFGLAQLHQLRGRVGRGEAVSFCFLCSGETTSLGRERLQAVVDCQDGYLLAEKDLLLRGAGNVFGTVQSGFPEFQFADPFDIEQMKKARHYAQALLQNDSSLEAHPLVKQHLSEAFEVIHLE